MVTAEFYVHEVAYFGDPPHDITGLLVKHFGMQSQTENETSDITVQRPLMLRRGAAPQDAHACSLRCPFMSP